MGGRNPETLPAPPGDIRAFDVRTGKLRWAFHTIPHPGEFGYDTWPKEAWKTSGAANNWAGMAVDRQRGIVYVPTGSAAMDFYLRAFDVETGKELWKAQLPASANATPMTYRLRSNGKQYLVIAAGGHPKITEEKLSDALVAFALP